MPGVALLRGRHLGIALIRLVLRRTRSRNNGRVHDRARAHQQPVLLQVSTTDPEHLLGQSMVFQPVPKFADRCLIWSVARLQTRKTPHGKVS